MYFWLHWIFIFALELSLAVVSGGYSSLQCTGVGEWTLVVAANGLSTCSTWGSLLHGIWNLPKPQIEPMSPALADGLSPTEPPEKSKVSTFIISILLIRKWRLRGMGELSKNTQLINGRAGNQNPAVWFQNPWPPHWTKIQSGPPGVWQGTSLQPPVVEGVLCGRRGVNNKDPPLSCTAGDMSPSRTPAVLRHGSPSVDSCWHRKSFLWLLES